MYGLLEVDVTVARQFIEEYKAQTGELLSFTGYLAFCLARAVDEDKAVQAYRKGRKQLVVFDDVNVGLMVERKIGRKARPDGSCHPGRQPQDLPGDPPGDPLGTVQPGAASAEDGHLVPFRHAASVAAVQVVQCFAPYGHTP